MKTIGRKIRITVTALTIVVLTSCSGRVANISAIETSTFNYLLPIIAKTATKLAQDKLHTFVTKREINEKVEQTEAASQKAKKDSGSKISLLSFGTTEAYLAANEKEEKNRENAGS